MQTSRRTAEFSGVPEELVLMLSKAKSSATKSDKYGLARDVFNGIEFGEDDEDLMRTTKAGAMIEEIIVKMTEVGEAEEDIAKAIKLIEATTTINPCSPCSPRAGPE